MNIIDIAIAKQLAGGGGGSGTDSYNDLSNLPKINDVTLSGNKSSSALGLQSEITSDSKLASDLVDDTNQDNKFVTSAEKTTWNGKQNAIDADHKINADYVDDSTSTNKFVTASDKETWNAKQNAIDNSHKLSSDLVDDANHTNKFVTSTEKQTWNAKQNAIDADHKLSSSLVSFSEAEAAAIASGIDSSKVGQISTNQTNILYAINNGVKNELDNFGTTSYESSGVTFTFNKDGSVHIKGTATGANATFYYYTGTYSYISNIYKGHILSGVTGGAEGTYGLLAQYSNNGTSWATQEMCKTAPITIKSDYNYVNICIIVFSGQTVDTTIYPMLCDPTVWAQSHDFMPPALPNYDLTYLQAEDRAALVEEIDSGAKNLIDSPTVTVAGITFAADSDHYITASPNNSDPREYTYANCQWKTHLKKGNYVLAIDIKTATSGNSAVVALLNSSSTIVATINNNQLVNKTGIVYSEFTVTTEGDYGVIMKCYAMVARLMICTKAAFGVSNKFVPYRPNWDLVQYMLPKSKTVSFNVTEANTYQIVSDLSIALPTGYTAQVSVTAWREASTPHTPASGIRIFTDSTGTSVLNESTVSVNESPVTQQLGLSTSTVVKNIGGNSLPVYVAVKYPSAVSIRVTIFYTIVPGSRDT